METLNDIVLTIQHYLADYILIAALLLGGIWFTVRLGFIQVRGFKEGLKRTFGGLFHKKGEAGADGMSSFQALATAIAAQVGTGNIAGAATALAIGGPGAIFWMWVAASPSSSDSVRQPLTRCCYRRPSQRYPLAPGTRSPESALSSHFLRLPLTARTVSGRSRR